MNNGVYLVSHLSVYYMYLSRAQHKTKNGGIKWPNEQYDEQNTKQLERSYELA